MNCAKETTGHEPCDASRCPLCGGANDCRLCATGAYKGPCWCEATQIPDALLARVPEALRNRACICKQCVEAFHRGELTQPSPEPERRTPIRRGPIDGAQRAGSETGAPTRFDGDAHDRAAERGAASPTSRRSEENGDWSQHSRDGRAQ